MPTGQRSGQTKGLYKPEGHHRGAIKGLRIGKIVFPGTFVLAGVVLSLSWALDVRPDPEVQQLLSSTPVAETFKQNRGRSIPAKDLTDSPLVVQAAAFARLIDPPKPVKQSDSGTVGRLDGPPPRPARSTPKFTLHATTLYPAQMERSMALICEPGSGFRWVKQGERVEHLVIEQIRINGIVYRDGERTGEVAIEAGKAIIDSPKTKPKVEHADSADPDQDVSEKSKPFTRVASNVDRIDGQAQPAASVPFKKINRVPLGPGR